MAERITPGQIKRTNRQQIYDYIYKNRTVSQLDIAYAMHISRPTVASNLAELEADGLIRKNGQLSSDQVGRKAVAYSITPDFRVAIGVEILADLVKLAAVDLYGKEMRLVEKKLVYKNRPAYYQELCGFILEFIGSLGIPDEKILGIGFAMEGLISADGRAVVYGEILDCTGLKIDVFHDYLPYPCSFIHDPDSAALSELWCSPELSSAMYLSLSRHLGGSMIAKRKIMTGKHGHTATFEHIRMRPRGELCYCGNRGCAETLCSMTALLADEDPEIFFRDVRAGIPEQVKRWHTYLKNLSDLIGILHLVCDVDFILGGHLAKYFTQEDIRFLYDGIRRSCPFEDGDNFIFISKMPFHNITVGASLPYIQAFLDDIGPGTGKE